MRSLILILLAGLSATQFVYAGKKLKQVAKIQITTSRLLKDVQANRIAETIWREDLNTSKVPANAEEVQNFIVEIRKLLADSLTHPGEHCLLAPRQADSKISKELKEIYRTHQLKKINQYLPNFIKIPQATALDSTIIPAFKAADMQISVGLFKAVMGTYPKIERLDPLPNMKNKVYSNFNSKPNLPLQYHTSKEEEDFVHRLTYLTGRKFKLISSRQKVQMVSSQTPNPTTPITDSNIGNIKCGSSIQTSNSLPRGGAFGSCTFHESRLIEEL